MKHVFIFVVVVSLLVVGHEAVYGNPLKSYTPQTSGGTLINFEGRSENEFISNQYSGVTFSQVGGTTYPGLPNSTPSRPLIDTYVNSENGWKFGYGASSGSAVLTGSTEGGFPFETVAGIRATFSSPVASVEVFLSDTSPFDTNNLGGPYTIAAYNSTGTLLESFVVDRGTVTPPDYSGGNFPPPGTTPLPGIYVGFLRASADIAYIEVGPSGNFGDAFAIDDLRFNATSTIANDDAYTTNEDVTLSVPTEGQSGVLANDTDSAGGTLTAELVLTPEHGTLTLNPNGSFTYVPEPNFNGVDTFYYIAKTGERQSNVAVVTITINAVNDPPFFDVIPDQFVTPPVNQSQTLHITGVTAGPADETEGEGGQFVTLSATSDNALVAVDPITIEGTVADLTYRRTGTGTGTATITVVADDNSGTATATFTRTFKIIVGASGTVEATLTGFSPNPNPNTAPTVQVTVTARPIDWNGNGFIDVPGDCYRIFPPLTGRYNIVPSGADTSPEGPPWRLPTRNPVTGAITNPGDTQEICGQARTFTATVDLSEWIRRQGSVTTSLDYVSIIRDLECLTDPNECVAQIWTGVRPVGDLTFTNGGGGASVADVNNVILHTVNTVQVGNNTTTLTSDTPIQGAIARVFDRNNSAFQNQQVRGVKVGKNPAGSLFDGIWESGIGQIATCTTPDSGVCIATESQAGDYLVIVKLVDKPHNVAVYDGLPKGVKDFVNGVATKSFTIVLKQTNGQFQAYQAGNKTVVTTCTLSICP